MFYSKFEILIFLYEKIFQIFEILELFFLKKSYVKKISFLYKENQKKSLYKK